MMHAPAFTIREGSSSVVAYKYGKGSNKTAEYCLSWYPRAGAKRKRESKTGERAARDRAREIAIALANDCSEVLELTGANRATFLHVDARAREIGLPLSDLVEQAVAAKKLIGTHSLVEAANFFERGFIIRKSCPATPLILAELLNSYDKPRSYRYVNQLRRDLNKFAGAFPDLSPLSAPEQKIRVWLRDLGLGPRRRDNVRDAVVRLSRFARSKNYLAEDRKSEAEKIQRIWEGSEVETFSPEETATLLEHISPRWKPWLLLGAYAGLRTTEIFRLDWAQVKLDQRVIAVKRPIAKKIRISRLAPITDNLLAWLEPYRTATGRLIATPKRKQRKQSPTKTTQSYPNEKTLERALEREIKRLEVATGIKWKHNGLRHSFGSNRLAIVKSYTQVAIEMGNSEDRVRENYNDPKSEAEGVLYFSHTPPEAIHNVVPMALPLEYR
jgi:integrase